MFSIFNTSIGRQRIAGLIVGIGLFTNLTAGCSQPLSTTPEGPAATGVPHLFVPNQTRSLGVVALGRHEVKFQIQNRGDAELLLRSVTSSCGCTKVQLSASVVPPQGEVTLVAVITPTRSESRDARIVLETNDKDAPKSDLKLNWIAKGPLEVTPSVIDFGVVRPDVPTKMRVTLTRNLELGGADAKIHKTVASPSGVLTVEALPLDPDKSIASSPPAEQYEVTLTASRKREPHGHVQLALSDRKDSPSQIDIPVVWQVRDSIEVSPQRIFLGSNEIGKPVAGALLITSDEGTKLVVGEVNADEAWPMMLTTDQVDDETVRISIQSQIAAAEVRKGTLRIHVTSPEVKTLEVPISEFGKIAAVAKASE